jgi:hypothetical protein
MTFTDSISFQMIGEVGQSCTTVCDVIEETCVASTLISEAEIDYVTKDLFGYNYLDAEELDEDVAPGFTTAGKRVYASEAANDCDAVDPNVARIWFAPCPSLSLDCTSCLAMQLLWRILPH